MPCDHAFNPPFLGGKIIELAKFCFMSERYEPNLSFLSKLVIVSHCVKFQFQLKFREENTRWKNAYFRRAFIKENPTV